MKLKYYLRGAGIGVIVTTIILMIAFHAIPEKEEEAAVSDTEHALTIAEALSEIEETEEERTTEEADTEALKETEEPPLETASESEAMEETAGLPEEDITPNEEEVQEEELPEALPPEEEVAEETIATAKPEVKLVSFRIYAGQSPGAVAKGLKDAGIIDDEEGFYQYLVEQGLNDFLEVGEFSVPEGGEFSEIARILTMNEYERKQAAEGQAAQ